VSHTNSILSNNRVLMTAATVAGSSTLTGPVIDMQGFEEITFDVLLGALTSGQTLGVLKVQGGNAANGSDMADLVGASLTVADADASKMEVLSVFRQQTRYVRLVFTRGSQAAAVQAITYKQSVGQRKQPLAALDSTVGQAVLAVEPQYSNTQLTTVTNTAPSGVAVVSTYRNAS